MPKFSKKFLFALGVLIFFSLISIAASPANAQEETSKLSVPFGGQVEFTSPAQYIKAIYNFSLGIGSVLALFLIVIGGIRYTLSEAVTNKSDSKDQIRGAVIGLILLLTSFLILQTVNPKITDLEDPDLDFIEIQKVETGYTPASCDNPETRQCYPAGAIWKDSDGAIYECPINCGGWRLAPFYYSETSLCGTLADQCMPGESKKDDTGYYECNTNCRWSYVNLDDFNTSLCGTQLEECKPGETRLKDNSDGSATFRQTCTERCHWKTISVDLNQ